MVSFSFNKVCCLCVSAREKTVREFTSEKRTTEVNLGFSKRSGEAGEYEGGVRRRSIVELVLPW